MRCPIWGHVFGSKKSKKSDPQSCFPSEHDFQKSSFCSNVPYTFIYTLLSADNRTTRHLLCDLLLKIGDFRTKSSGGNPIWGQNFSKFSLPKTYPQHPKNTAKKNFQKSYVGTGTCCGAVILGFISTVVLEELVRTCCNACWETFPIVQSTNFTFQKILNLDIEISKKILHP